MARLKVLRLSDNQQGAGLSSLAQACAIGALPSLENLYVDNIEYAGLQAACQARGIALARDGPVQVKLDLDWPGVKYTVNGFSNEDYEG